MPNPDTSLRTPAIPEYSPEESYFIRQYNACLELVEKKLEEDKHFTYKNLNILKTQCEEKMSKALWLYGNYVKHFEENDRIETLLMLYEKYIKRIDKLFNSVAMNKDSNEHDLEEFNDRLSKYFKAKVSFSRFNARYMLKNMGSALKLFEDFPGLSHPPSLTEVIVKPEHSKTTNFADAEAYNDQINVYARPVDLLIDRGMYRSSRKSASDHHELSHELGHVISYQLIDHVIDRVTGSRNRHNYYLFEGVFLDKWDPDCDLVSKALFQELSERLQQKGLFHYDISTTEGRAKACEEGIISKYASTNNAEMFAEFFRQYYQISYRNERRREKERAELVMPTVTKMFVETVKELFNDPDKLREFINRHKETLGELLPAYQLKAVNEAATSVRELDIPREFPIGEAGEKQDLVSIVSKLKSQSKASFKEFISDTSKGCFPPTYCRDLLLQIPYLDDDYKIVTIFDKLTDAQIEYLTYHKPHKISNSVLELLPERVIQKFSKKAIVRLDYSSWRKSEVDYVIHKLSPEQIALLGYEQIHSVSNSNLALLSDQQVQKINSEYVIPRLSKGELKSLLKNFSETQIKALTYEQIHKFTRWELRDLKPDFVKFLSQEVVRRLNQTEYSALMRNLTEQQKSWWEHRSEAILQIEVVTAAVAAEAAASAAPASEVAAGEVAASEITAESADGQPQTEAAETAEGQSRAVASTRQNGDSLLSIVSATLAGGADGADRDPLAPSESADEGAKKGTSDGASFVQNASEAPKVDQFAAQPAALPAPASASTLTPAIRPPV